MFYARELEVRRGVEDVSLTTHIINENKPSESAVSHQQVDPVMQALQSSAPPGGLLSVLRDTARASSWRRN
jgi:hypothetical protein